MKGTTPQNYSRYKETGNHAIDLVAQSVGFHKAMGKPLDTIFLSPGKWRLFVEGMKVLHGMKGQYMDRFPEFTFEGVNIVEGSRMQVDPLRYKYKEAVVN